MPSGKDRLQNVFDTLEMDGEVDDLLNEMFKEKFSLVIYLNEKLHQIMNQNEITFITEYFVSVGAMLKYIM